MSTGDTAPKPQDASAEPREDLIKTAVKFLQNPQVSKSPLSKSQKFLKSKGLTDQEVQIACEQSGIYNLHYFNEKPPSLPAHIPMQQMYLEPPQSLFRRVKDTLQSVALFSGLIYAAYLFYKKFIKPWLFGERKKKSIEDSLSDLNKTVTDSINDLSNNLSEVKVQVDRITNTQSNGSTHVQLQDLKSEIAVVKGLLLNRKTFPSVSGTMVPPSIPEWQLSSVPHGHEGAEGHLDCNKAANAADTEAEELMEIGSGSGSSETEVVTKNSDSSLEIM